MVLVVGGRWDLSLILPSSPAESDWPSPEAMRGRLALRHCLQPSTMAFSAWYFARVAAAARGVSSALWCSPPGCLVARDHLFAGSVV